MGKNERKGDRRNREDRKRRIPYLGYYLIITDTNETEKNYFDGIKRKIPSHLRDHIVVKVEKTSTKSLITKALQLRNDEPQYRLPWIIFDRDQVDKFDEIINDAENAGLKVGWSNPCFEIFLLSYFNMLPVVNDSVKCCVELERVFTQKTNMDYEKADKRIYEKLCRYGDEKKALGLAARKHQQLIRDEITKPSEMISCTTVYVLVSEINRKIIESC